MTRSQENSSSSDRYWTLLRPEVLGETVRELRVRVLEGEIGAALHRFGTSTTAHGIPRACAASHLRGRYFWLLIVVVCGIAFAYQFSLVCGKYNRKEKIVNVELVFATAPFPAITVCNLNPFKKHLVQTIPQISSMLSTFHQAVSFSKDANQYVNPRLRRSSPGSSGHGGDYSYVQHEPVLSDCLCTSDLHNECIQQNSVPIKNTSLCICVFDKQDESAWPCFNSTVWHQDICRDCNDIGYCNLPLKTLNETAEDVGDIFDCLCRSGRLNYNYCLLKPERMTRMWERHGKLPDRTSPFLQEFIEQLADLGYANMTDEVAITIKTKENLVLTMASLPVQHRMALSYGKAEFIKMCSFNGQQCDINKDFKLHVDPAFGNCYTFNVMKPKALVSNRAGPSYGLRLMIFVNASDYLPTTEATGVRIAIHGRKEYPYPDAFGYNAPTGFVSSFGLSLRKVNRLSVPYAECLPPDTPLPDSYIFSGYKYEPEGCMRSCYQHMIVKECGCADPRFPSPNGSVMCDSLKDSARNCLSHHSDRFTKEVTCQCSHPCVQDAFSTTYSAARWPSGSYQVGDCDKGPEKCLAYYMQNAAMVEIYYEQLSFEVLTETEAYLLVNLVSDFGGQLGLWMGFSFITMVEVFVLLFDLITMWCRSRKIEKERKKHLKRLSHQEISEHFTDTIANHSSSSIRPMSKSDRENSSIHHDIDLVS